MSRYGKFVWWEVMTSDVEAATAFYADLFGWNIADVEMESGSYRMIMNGEAGIGGVVPNESGEAQPSLWLSYLSVEDVDAATAAVSEAGGSVVKPPYDIPGVGRMSIVADPQGAYVAPFLWADSGADSDLDVAHGNVNWNELHAADAHAAFAFYAGLTGWQKLVMAMDGSDYLVANPADEPDDRGLAGVIERMSDEMPPFWLPYVTVDDVDAVSARVVDLGGTLMVEPTDIPDVGRFSMLVDPTGATLGVMTYSNEE